MKKTDKNTAQADVWGEAAADEVANIPVTAEDPPEIAVAPTPFNPERVGTYDLEGLMTDFPTATELQRFVFDETGIVLNLKGRANKLKYQVAMDALNGEPIDAAFIGRENPYIDKTDLVPVEPMRELPPRPSTLPNIEETQNVFHSRFVPHPDAEMRANGKRVDVEFRKYRDRTITYKVLGPLSQRSEGEKLDKYGRVRPEIIRWIDPRTEERIIVTNDGRITPTGQKLRALMQAQRVNNSNVWDTWIDRDFISTNLDAISNPWADEL